jgi:hemolysin activation/secretion protein
VKGFRFQPANPNRVLKFGTNELAGLLADYVGKELDDVNLQAAAHRITEYYLKHGYINSGAQL